MQLKLISKKYAKTLLKENGVKDDEVKSLIAKTKNKQIMFGIDAEEKFSVCVVGNKAGNSKRVTFRPAKTVAKYTKKPKIFEDEFNMARGFTIALHRVFQK